MFISPKTALAEGWVKFPDWMTEEQQQKCIQPNALDFTIDDIQQVIVSPCYIGEDSKIMRVRKPITVGETGVWHLEFAGVYDFMSDFYLDLPEGIAVQMIARSTFVRNGLFITSGLWDSGFKGPAGGILNSMISKADIQQHTRVGQLIFVQTDKGGLYAGGYNTAEGEHWTKTLETK